MTVASGRADVAAPLVAAACGLGALVALAAGVGPLWAVTLVAAGAAVLGSVLLAVRVLPLDLLVGAGVAASCTDAVRLGPGGLFDLLCAAGVVVVAVDAVVHRDEPVRWPPRVCRLAIGGFGLATVLVTIFPPDSFYMSSRYELALANLSGAVDAAPDGGATNLGGLARLTIGLLAVPLVLAWYARTWPRMDMVGRAFLCGAAVSCLLGLTDYAGVTSVGEALIGYTNGGDRVTGLTTQPNQLALTAVMALPFAWFLVRGLLLRAALVVVLLAGTVASGSRVGLIGAAVVLVTCLAWRYRARFLLLGLPLGAAALLSASELLSFTRFGTDGAAGADLERTRALHQGIDDFAQSPLFGVGLRVGQEAHVVYLQLLAGSGLIGLLSFGLLVGTALTFAYRLRQRPVVLAAGIALVGYLVVGAASNALLVRYLFVPLAIVLVAARHLDADGVRPAAVPTPGRATNRTAQENGE